MKNYLLSLLFLSLLKIINAQTPSFSWSHSFSQNVVVMEHAIDNNNNIILGGYFSGTVDFDFGSGSSTWTASNEDAFLAKYTPGGQLIWKIVFSSTSSEAVNDLTVDASDNIFIKASGVLNTVDLDPGAGTAFLNSSGNFIAKYSSSGQFQWADRLDILTVFTNGQNGNYMTIDNVTQDLILTGGYVDTIDIDPSAGVQQLIGNSPSDQTFFMARFNTNGQLLWANDFDGSNTNNVVLGHDLKLEQVKTDLLGNIFIIGHINGTIDMDPSVGIANLTNTYYICKYNSLGQLLIAQSFAASPMSFDIDSQNNIVLGGWFVNVVDFDLGAGTQSLNAGPSSGDFFVAKYSNTLSYIWAFTHSNTPNTFSGIHSVFVDTSDDIFVYGYYDLPFNASDFDPGAGVYTVPIGTGVFVAKYSGTNDLLMFGSFSGPLANNVTNASMNKISNKILLYGDYNGTIDFDMGVGVYNVTHVTGQKFLTRYDMECVSSPVYISDTICYGDTLHFGTNSLYTSGMHSIVSQSLSGCDSTFAVNLFVHPQNVNNMNVTICSTQNYFFDGTYISTPGVYHDTLISFTGCDSIVNLTLSVIPLNGSVTQSGYVLTTSETAANSYQWFNCTNNTSVSGATGISFSVSTTGSYGIILSKGGCIDTTVCQMVTAPSSAINTAPANLWGNQYETLNAEFFKVDKNGNSYLAGTFLPAVDLDPGVGTFAAPYDIEGIYFIKYGPSGDLIWAKWIETTTSLYLTDMEVDSSGAILLSGGFSGGGFDVDAGTGSTIINATGTSSIFLFKYDFSGNFQWASAFGGAGDNYPSSIAIDRNNNVYMTGYFEDDIDFDPSAAVNVISTMGGNVFNFIVKYSSAGAYLSGVGIENWVLIDKITVDKNDDILYSGSYWDLTDIAPGPTDYFVDDLSSGSQQNAFVVKVDQGYNFISGLGISSDMLLQITDITTDASASLFVTGYFRSAINDFDPSISSSSLVYAANDDVFLAKYSPSFSLQWVRGIGNNDSDYSNSLCVDTDNNAYVFSRYGNTLDADATSGMLMLNCSGISDNYVDSYDSLGNFNWAFRVGSTGDDFPVGMGVDNLGNVFVCGNATGAVSFLGENNSSIRSVASGAFVAKYGTCSFYTNTVTDNGPYLTANNATGPYQWYNCSTSLPISGASNQSFYPSSAGQYSVLIGNGTCAVMSSCVNFSGPTTVELNNIGQELLLYPNPNDGNFNVQFNAIERSNYRIEIYNAIGQKVYAEELNQFQGSYNKRLSVVEYGRGIYTINLVNVDHQTIKKMVVY